MWRNRHFDADNIYVIAAIHKNRLTALDQVLFVAAVFAASATWQLVHGVGGLSQPNRIRSQTRDQERIRCRGG